MNFQGVRLFASDLFHHSNLNWFIIHLENRVLCISSILKFETFMNGGRKIKIFFFNHVIMQEGLRLAEVLNYIFLSEITYSGLQARQAGFPSSILKLG